MRRESDRLARRGESWAGVVLAPRTAAELWVGEGVRLPGAADRPLRPADSGTCDAAPAEHEARVLVRAVRREWNHFFGRLGLGRRTTLDAVPHGLSASDAAPLPQEAPVPAASVHTDRELV